MPSNSRQMMCEVSTPPCMIRSSTSQPTSLIGRAVTTEERLPQHLRMARQTLYSPPPSHTWKMRVVRTRPKPGSRRSITSPSETQSHLVSEAGRILRISSAMFLFPTDLLDERNGLGDLLFDAFIVLGL